MELAKKIGVFVGKFLPPHIGHLSVIDRMISECDEGVIVISDNPEKSKYLCETNNFPYFSSKERMKWFQTHYKNNKNVHFAIIDESKIANSQNFMKDYAKLFWESVFYKVNVKYADKTYEELNKLYFPQCEFVAIDRDKIEIHATDIRRNYNKYKTFVITEARADIDKKIIKTYDIL